MKRILVTGAGGFAGGFLLPALRAAFAETVVLASAFDVTDRDAVFAGVGAAAPGVCVHLAAIAAIGQAEADPDRAWAVNLHGALNVAQAILLRAPDCRLIYVSTAEVYGGSFASGVALDETATLAPLNLYAATKAAAEEALGALTARGLKLLRLRPFNHTGPGQSEAFVAPAFAGQIARIETGQAPPVLRVGALTPERDFLDVRDVCAAYVECVRRFDELANNDVLNIASGEAVRIGDLLNLLLARAKQKISVEEDPAKLRPVEILRAAGDVGKARDVLGWRPVFSLDETLAAVLEAARTQARISSPS